MTSRLRTVGIVAPSFVVPSVEFGLGVAQLESAGWAVRVHPQCQERDFMFAGTDDRRAQAFWEYATDPALSVVWCGRGGYGAVRILRFLEEWTRRHGKPSPKLLIGYSDATALLEYARNRWGWSTLHAPMPAVREFSLLPHASWRALAGWVNGARDAGFTAQLRPMAGTRPVGRTIEARVVGGNLSIWASLMGTPYAPRTRGDLLFFEDIGEAPYRIDRMIQQLAEGGIFESARGIVLGTFMDCVDATAQALRKHPPAGSEERARVLRTPQASELRPLRPVYAPARWQQEIFGGIGRRFNLPVLSGMPVGHGRAGFVPLPLGATYRLTRSGRLSWVKWPTWETWRK